MLAVARRRAVDLAICERLTLRQGNALPLVIICPSLPKVLIDLANAAA